jgi:thiol-disulfide isomerase/thioredoxin
MLFRTHVTGQIQLLGDRAMTRIAFLTWIVLTANAPGYAGAAASEIATAQAARRLSLVQQVRAELSTGNFSTAEKILAAQKRQTGITPEWLEAHSWMARAHLTAGRGDDAERYARETLTMATNMLTTRAMDGEPHLPIAYGAAAEVLAQVSAQSGARSEAIALLERELRTHASTSIAKRLQKNINLLTLEGRRAPDIVATDYLGPKPPSMTALRGKPIILLFWAHWCSDCKRMAPILAILEKKYRDRGLVLFAPTQRYGYLAGGKDAAPEEEKAYIDQVRKEHYGVLAGQAVPLDEANHLRYGVSTTPTLVLVDRTGIVRLYHPGGMTLDELEPQVQKLVAH